MNLLLRTLFLFVFFFITGTFFALNATSSSTHVRFSENKGQWENKVLFRAQLDGGVLFFEPTAFTYHFYDKEFLRKNHASNTTVNLGSFVKSHALKMNFKNANDKPLVKASKPSSDYSNYFIGNNPAKWASFVKSYEQLYYQNLYEGIHLEIAGLQNSIKYNFIVEPNAEVKNIIMAYEGIKELTLENEYLKVKTSVNEMIEQQPFAYQWINGKKINIPCRFKLNNNEVSFELDKYNHNYQLIIDPIQVYATYSGSPADNFGMTATYDTEGNLYAGGTAFDIGYPVTPGAFDTSYNGIVAGGRTDVVITKYNPTLGSLVYSTYIGGAASTEIVSSLIVNAQNELLLFGATGSDDFPVTPGAYTTFFKGGSAISFPQNGTIYSSGTDIYVSKFNSTGSALIGSTFIGGSLNDGVNNSGPLSFNYGDYYRGEIQLDNFDNCYIASCTYSTDFPTTDGVVQTSSKGGLEGCVFKMSPDLTSLIWSTYLGNNNDEACYALTVDDSSIVYVTGGTNSPGFPHTPGVYQTSYGGGQTDGYITKINKTGSAILSSTFLGTSSYDQSFFVQLDKAKNVYVYGQSLGNFTITPSTVYSNPNSGQFINKFNNTLDTLIYGTVFGNGNNQVNLSPSAFLVDDCENVYMSGWGGNILTNIPTNNMPVTAGAFQTTTDGFNFYLMVLQKDIVSLLYATYFGGGTSQEHVDGGTSRFDKKGIVYQSVCAGCGGNSDFPTTPGAYSSTNNNSNCNNGVFKFDFGIKLATASFTSDGLSGCAPLTIQFTNNSPATATYFWDFGGNDTTSTVYSPTRTYSTAGTYLVKLTVNDTTSCNHTDSLYKYVTVYEPPVADFDYDISPCRSTVNFYDSSTTASGVINSWQWNFDDGETATVQNPVHLYNGLNDYDVTLVIVNNNGCSDTALVQVSFPVAGAVSASKDTVVCGETTVQLLASGGISYSWVPPDFLSAANIPNPVYNPFLNPSSTTSYTVFITTLMSNGDTCIFPLITKVTQGSLIAATYTIYADRDTIFKGENTRLHIGPVAENIFLWTPVNTLDSPPSSDPLASPEKTTNYQVLIQDTNGCYYNKNIAIVVLPNYCGEPDIFIPNSFTPNIDNKNDVLYVRGNNIKEIYFAVYNRWGEKVFDTNNKSVGWDGTYKGMKADPGVFAYYFKVKCYYGGLEYEKKGNVTLVR